MAIRTKFARLARYSRKFGEASHLFLKNGLWRVSASVGESGESVNSAQDGSANIGESAQHGLANVGESVEYSPSLLANVDKIGHF